MSRRATVAGAALALAACASLAQPEGDALRVTPDEASQAELVRVVSAALGRSSVTITTDALTRDSLLIIEPVPARDATGQRMGGRDLGLPEHFRLLSRGGDCTLLHEQTGKRYELRASRCVVVRKDAS
jgi:hypothetical protein